MFKKKDTAYYAEKTNRNLIKALNPPNERRFPWSRKKDSAYYTEKACESAGNTAYSFYSQLNNEVNTGQERRDIHRQLNQAKREVTNEWNSVKKELSHIERRPEMNISAIHGCLAAAIILAAFATLSLSTIAVCAIITGALIVCNSSQPQYSAPRY